MTIRRAGSPSVGLLIFQLDAAATRGFGGSKQGRGLVALVNDLMVQRPWSAWAWWRGCVACGGGGGMCVRGAGGGAGGLSSKMVECDLAEARAAGRVAGESRELALAREALELADSECARLRDAGLTLLHHLARAQRAGPRLDPAVRPA